jgi:ABC-type polysaccharide/polyol phosphate transport system ATPase subunit
MSDDVLVRVENVSKRFCRSLKRSLWYGLQDLGSELGGRRHGGSSGLPRSSADVQLRKDEFWAVKDVSFELRRGECLGLIGRNGAGKTTLLRMLNGLIKPDTGRVEMKGHIGAMIALGAGFNPLLTGRENIFTSASVLGITEKRAKSKLEEIVEFAELNDFIDSPVQTYSSGMQVRLGFAVASSLDVDVLLLDEVLAVGDAAFRGKCFNRMISLLNRSAVIFVSHNMAQIGRISSSIGTMTKGSLKFYSHSLAEGISQYNLEAALSLGSCNTSEGIAKIMDVKIERDDNHYTAKPKSTIHEVTLQEHVFSDEACISIVITYVCSENILLDPFVVLIDNELNNAVQIRRKAKIPSRTGSNRCIVRFPASAITGGNYHVSCALFNQESDRIEANNQYCATFTSLEMSGYAPVNI